MIHTEGLTRTFRVNRSTSIDAVRGVDLDVRPGELVALLGPNGAGKSTTLRMLTTLLPPSAGKAWVAGREVTADPAGVRQRIGYIGQGSGAADGQRVRDELVIQGRCYGLGWRESRRRADELLALLGLESQAKRTATMLSGGQRRRLDIALGLIHRPELMFLDEPSTGLDPQNRLHLWQHIRQLREEHGTTMLLTTHYLEEADAMSERVVIIDHGKVIADGTVEKLKSELAGDRITVTLPDPSSAASAAEIARRTAHEATVDSETVRLRVSEGNVYLPEYLRATEAAGLRVITAESHRPTLDDVFLALTGRSLREDEAA